MVAKVVITTEGDSHPFKKGDVLRVDRMSPQGYWVFPKGDEKYSRLVLKQYCSPVYK